MVHLFNEKGKSVVSLVACLLSPERGGHFIGLSHRQLQEEWNLRWQQACTPAHERSNIIGPSEQDTTKCI